MPLTECPESHTCLWKGVADGPRCCLCLGSLYRCQWCDEVRYDD